MPSKKRKFYFVRMGRGERGSGFRLANGEELFREPPPIFAPPPGRRGFRKYDATPIFLADPRLGMIHRDLEMDAGYWFISDRMRTVIESIDREAFAFLKCKVQMRDGSEGPVRWLCDVVRVLDALDEENSDVFIGTADNGSKVYNLKSGGEMTFKPSVIGSQHVFRMKYFEAATVCDDDFRLACKSAELTGVRFKDRR